MRRTLTLAVAISLCVLRGQALAAGPGNDAFYGADLSVTHESVLGTNVGATSEQGEPSRICNSGPQTVWYHWTAPADAGLMILDTLNADTTLDTILELYTGAGGIETLGLRSCSDDVGGATGSQLVWQPDPGATYFIRVSGFGSDTGSFRLAYRFHRCTVEGTPDPETLVGTSGNDVVCGDVSQDIVRGLGGDDFLTGWRAEGGAGNDFVFALAVSYIHAPHGVVVDLRDFTGSGEGKDTIYTADILGSPFDDRLSGDSGRNHIFGRNGDDALYGRGAAGPSAGDALYGGKGNDTCESGPC